MIYKALKNALMYGEIIKVSYYKMIPQTRSIKKHLSDVNQYTKTL